MSLPLYLRYMIRESRGSGARLLFFVVCLAVGVAAVVSVAGMSAGIDEGLRGKAREMLAADLAVGARRPLPAELDEAIGKIPGAERADTREFVSVVVAASGPAAGASRLAELKSVSGRYPFYGDLETEPRGPLSGLVDGGRAVVARALLSQLQLGTGDRIRIGGVDFTIAAVLINEPDRLEIGLTSLAPRIFLSPEGMDRAGLIRLGSRVEYKALVKMPEGATAAEVAAAAEAIDKAIPDSAFADVETYTEAQPALRAGFRRASRFLGLVALLSLLVGGIGVAQTVRAWLAGRIDAIATLKCLGARPREILALYMGQTALMGLAGSLAGAAAGVVIQWAIPWVMRDMIPVEEIGLWQPAAIARGIALGVGVALLFSIAPLLAVRRVPPARVFRHDAEPLEASRWARALVLLIVLAGIAATALVQSGSVPLAAGFTGGGVALVGVLALAALAATKALSKLPRERARVWLRHGLTALSRPGAGTLGAIVALGVGVAVVLGMYLIERRVSGEFEAEMPADAPSAFMVDIQPGQWDGVRALLETEGATRIDSVPVVNARLSSVDGVAVEELAEQAAEGDRKRWVLTREQRLTYMSALPEGNEIVEGSDWALAGEAEVSVEKEFARDMGAKVGSVLVLDVQGRPVTLKVSSLRTVKWESFKINFFLIVEPGVLEEAPQIRLAAARLPREREQQVQDKVAASYPNVTFIQIRAVLERIVAVLGQAGLGVQVLGGFTVVAGVFILAGAVSAGSIRRGREVALLKTLGMTGREVLAVYSVEYALVGAVAGILGSAGGGVMAYLVLTRFMELEWETAPAAFAVAMAGTVALSVAAGAAASWRALSLRPVEVLRGE